MFSGSEEVDGEVNAMMEWRVKFGIVEDFLLNLKNISKLSKTNSFRPKIAECHKLWKDSLGCCEFHTSEWIQDCSHAK